MSLKDEYFAKMTSQFRRWDAELGMLAGKGEQVSDAARAQYDEQLNAMRASRKAAFQRLQDIRTAHESGWRAMQAGLDDAWRSMKLALERATSQYKQ
jgi:hypothetical protein